MASRDRLYDAGGRGRGPQASQATLVPMAESSRGGGLSQPEFFDQVEEVTRVMKDVDYLLPQLEQLHSSALLTVSQDQTIAVRNQISAKTEEIEDRLHAARRIIGDLDKATKKDRKLSRSDRQVRVTQQKRIITNLQDRLSRFREAERLFREKYRERIKRQYRIVNPAASERELEGQVDNFINNPGSQSSIFAQSMLAQSRQQLNSAQNDADAMRRLEASIQELATSFQDLQMMLASQDEQLTHVEEHIEVAVTEIQQAAVEISVAKETRKSSRKKLWWITCLCLVIIIIVALIAWNQICGGFNVTCKR